MKVQILPLLGKYPIGDVTPADVQRVVNTWSAMAIDVKTGARGPLSGLAKGR